MNLIIRANGPYLRPRNGNLYQQKFQALREIMEKGEDAQRYFTTVEPNDVLLGRGAPIINNEGNVRFRKIVAERKDEYQASRRHQFKNKIAAEIIEIVHQRNGRFLRMADDTDELKVSGCIPKDAKTVWTFAEDSAILQKVKQALRELEVAATSTTMPDQKRKRTDATHLVPNRSTMSKRSRNHNLECPLNSDGYSSDLFESRDITSSTEYSSKNLKKSAKPGRQLNISLNQPHGLLEVANKPLPVTHENVYVQEIKNHLEPRQEENSAKPLRVANQLVLSTDTSERFIGNSIGTRQPTHNNYHAVVPIYPNQANEMMDSIHPQRPDDTSVFSADELLLQQQLLLQDQQEYHRNMLVFQHQRQEQERQLQLMQLDRNQYQQQMEWHSNTPTTFNAEILATDLPVHNQLQPSQAYDDGMRNSSEMFEPAEFDQLRQNQLHLVQLQYVSGLLPAEYNPNLYSMSESHQRNNLIAMQQDMVRLERDSMGVNRAGGYRDRSQEQPLPQDSSLDRLIALSIQTGINDSFRNQAYTQIFHTDNENDKVDDDQIVAFKNLFDQNGAR